MLLLFGMQQMLGALKSAMGSQMRDVLGKLTRAHGSAVLTATFVTAVVHSSSATTAIVITMAGQGLITLEAGIALAFGASIGTCVTVLVATLGRPVEAVRAAAVHVIFNAVGVML